MRTLQEAPIAHVEPTFWRLLAALGGGVVLVTGVLSLTISAPGLALGLGLLVLVAFSAVVLHEVGRLLDDEEGSDH